VPIGVAIHLRHIGSRRYVRHYSLPIAVYVGPRAQPRRMRARGRPL